MASPTESLTPADAAQLHAMLKGLAASGPHDPSWTEALGAIGDFVVKLGWPILVAVVLWRLFPAITAIVRSRAFSIEIAGMKVSVQDATEQIRAQIDDLQQQVIKLREGAGATAAPGLALPPAAALLAEPPAADPAKRRVLWVDDTPQNNAFQIAQLERDGVRIVQSLSTEDAMAILKTSPRFDAVISDMGRREQGRYDGQAGLSLLRRMRGEGFETPFIVYTTLKGAEQAQAQVRAAGGQGATASPVELLEWVRARFAENRTGGGATGSAGGAPTKPARRRPARP